MLGAYFCGCHQWGGWAAFLQFPQTGLKLWLEWGIPHHMAPSLASKTLEGVRVPPVGCTFTPSISPLTALPLISTYSSPCPMASRCAVVQGSLSKTGLALVGAGAASSTPVCTSLSMASLPGAAWDTRWVAALPNFGQGSHQFGNLLPQFCSSLPRVRGHCSPSSYFAPHLLIFAFCLLGSNHYL